MKTSLILERAGGFFRAESHESRSPWLVRAPSPFITISRQSGSGGSSLAEQVARILNQEQCGGVPWRIFEGNLPAKMLQLHHLSAHLARFLPEDHVSEFTSSIGELLGLHPNLWELGQKMNATMRQLAAEGQVILVGRGANFATAENKQGVHVRLVAPADHRARFVARQFGLSEADALLHNVKCDAARRRYVADNFNARVEDPSAYDLVINTAHVPLDEAAQLVASRIRSRVAAAA